MSIEDELFRDENGKRHACVGGWGRGPLEKCSICTPPPTEIAQDLLGKVVPGVSIYTEDMAGGLDHEYDATVADLREMLRPLGLDVTTKEALAWGTEYPTKARNINRICELQQEIADLQHELGIVPASAVVHKKVGE